MTINILQVLIPCGQDVYAYISQSVLNYIIIANMYHFYELELLFAGIMFKLKGNRCP